MGVWWIVAACSYQNPSSSSSPSTKETDADTDADSDSDSDADSDADADTDPTSTIAGYWFGRCDDPTHDGFALDLTESGGQVTAHGTLLGSCGGSEGCGYGSFGNPLHTDVDATGTWDGTTLSLDLAIAYQTTSSTLSGPISGSEWSAQYASASGGWSYDCELRPH